MTAIMDEDRDLAKAITTGGELSSLSLEEIDERVAILEDEIERLKQARIAKAQSMSDAESFFKIPG